MVVQTRRFRRRPLSWVLCSLVLFARGGAIAADKNLNKQELNEKCNKLRNDDTDPLHLFKRTTCLMASPGGREEAMKIAAELNARFGYCSTEILLTCANHYAGKTGFVRQTIAGQKTIWLRWAKQAGEKSAEVSIHQQESDLARFTKMGLDLFKNLRELYPDLLAVDVSLSSTAVSTIPGSMMQPTLRTNPDNNRPLSCHEKEDSVWRALALAAQTSLAPSESNRQTQANKPVPTWQKALIAIASGLAVVGTATGAAFLWNRDQANNPGYLTH